MSGVFQATGNGSTVYGNQSFNLPVINLASPIGAVTVLTLSSGDNTITIPAGTTIIIIQPPANNAAVLKLKSVAGDTGILISLTSWQILQTTSGQTTFIINSASAGSAATTITFL